MTASARLVIYLIAERGIEVDLHTNNINPCWNYELFTRNGALLSFRIRVVKFEDAWIPGFHPGWLACPLISRDTTREHFICLYRVSTAAWLRAISINLINPLIKPREHPVFLRRTSGEACSSTRRPTRYLSSKKAACRVCLMKNASTEFETVTSRAI